MSYDLSIHFPHAVFPAKSWEDMLASFSGPDCELCPARASSAEAGVKHGDLLVSGWSPGKYRHHCAEA